MKKKFVRGKGKPAPGGAGGAGKRGPGPRGRAVVTPRKPAGPNAPGWGHVASWYDGLVGDEGSEFHREVVLPGVERLLGGDEDRLPGRKVLDLCCGQGVLCRRLHAAGAKVMGVDAATPLIAAAKQRSKDDPEGGPLYVVGDARKLFEDERAIARAGGVLKVGRFDAVTCVLAMQDVDDLPGLCRSASMALRVGGRFVGVIMHPCFRVPKRSSWGFDAKQQVQYRRVEGYLSETREKIVTNPGAGPDSAFTWSHHRPLGAYIGAMSKAWLMTIGLEEWPSHKTSDSGPRAAAENVSREEVPMFLAVVARKLPPPGAISARQRRGATPD